MSERVPVECNVPIFDAKLVEAMVRQSINFDTLQTVVKAECDRIIIKVIQPQIDNWLRDIAQQINRDVEQLLKKTFGDPEGKQDAFKEELLQKLAEAIVGNKENMEKFVRELVHDYNWSRDPGAAILQKFLVQVGAYVSEWWQTHQPQIEEKLNASISEFLATPAASLISRNIIATIDLINDVKKRQDDLQNQLSQQSSRIAAFESGRRY